MDNDKFNAVVEYFSSLNIELPSDVKNAIEDVFRENDDVTDVECYHSEDVEQFGIDLSPQNIAIMNLDGSNSGEAVSFYTYYGEVEHDLLEEIMLFDGDDLHTEISKIEGSGTSKLVDENDYTVILVERTKWDSKASVADLTTTLMIYCPYPADGISDEDLRFQGIYNEIKAVENGD